MSELSVQRHDLPANIEDLSKFVLVGREKLVAVRAEIRAIDKVGLAQEVREQKLREAQDIAEAVLDAEVKIGELMAKVQKAAGGDRRSENFKSDSGVTFEKTNADATISKIDALREAGFTGSDDNIKKMASRFQALAAHPEIVEQAKAEARQSEDIVSRAQVLNMVKEQRREELRAERDTSIQEQIARPKTSNHVDIYSTDRKYRVIYADPPWQYNDRQNVEVLGGAAKHYLTMPLKDICGLPVPTEENAVLFIWATSPMLEDSFKVINAWGFKYKSSFVWDKVAHNMGHYNSVRHELLLIATKGSCTPDVKRLFDSVVSIERTEHSRKPSEFRNMIDTLYPTGTRLEMFAREAPDGWDVWGNMA